MDWIGELFNIDSPNTAQGQRTHNCRSLKRSSSLHYLHNAWECQRPCCHASMYCNSVLAWPSNKQGTLFWVVQWHDADSASGTMHCSFDRTMRLRFHRHARWSTTLSIPISEKLRLEKTEEHPVLAVHNTDKQARTDLRKQKLGCIMLLKI